MANPRNAAAEKPTVLQAPTIPGYSQSGGGGSTSGEASFTGIENPEALQMLMATLSQLASGGTPEMQRQRGERNAEIASARRLRGDYSKASAFQDAADLMAQNLRQAMEKNLPVINKGIENAGTSGSSMGALLAQKLATESSQAAGALGAQQAVSYGNIASNVQATLEALTRVDNSQLEALLKGLELSKVSRGSRSSFTAPQWSNSVTASGGGSVIAPASSPAPVASPYQDGVWYGPPTSGDSSYVPVGTPRSYYPDGKLPPAAPYGGAGTSGSYGIQQGMTPEELYRQANQSNEWATSFDW